MKKLLIAIASVLALNSCSGDIEQQAQRQMKKTIAGFYEGKGNYEIADVETFYSDDSVCVIRFKFTDRYQSDIPHRSEYVYLKLDDGDRELLLDLEAQTSVKQTARETSKKLGITVEKELPSAAKMMTLFAGRKVRND